MSGWWRIQLTVTGRGHASAEVNGNITSTTELAAFEAKLNALAKFLPKNAEEQSNA